MELVELFKMLQGGGNIALMVSAYWIYKAEFRLARIEFALGIDNLKPKKGESNG